jgi:oxygen-independent coproporphyrinogen-3 oxidase
MELSSWAGLYVHVPFCRCKCNYCNFFSFQPRAGDQARFITAVRAQMRRMAELPQVRELAFTTIFFGGGTPSVLPVEILAVLLGDLRALFTMAVDEPEISIEINPATIDADGLLHLRRAGFNRLSIGVQSLEDAELRLLGRLHTVGEAVATIAAARQAGFDNLSFDLMYGLPGQTASGWQATLDRALGLDPVHLSMYELTVEEGTPCAEAVADGRMILPAEEEVLAMMAAIDAAIGRSRLVRYEMSNYALPGRECRHNLNYWHNGLYLGFGPGAVSSVNGARITAVADLDAYCRLIGRGQPGWQETERLDREAAFRETVVMGLRMLAGVNVAALRERFGLDLLSYYGPTLERLVGQGWLCLRQGCLQLTPKGLPLADRIMAELV